MNDRIRVYELARQMNLPNQDLINALRELGYDIKSHSSTVESHVVSLVIAHLGKKKEGAVPKKMTKTITKPGKAVAAKVVAPPAPPTPVKPRVLSRRKPTPVVDAIAAEADGIPASPTAPTEPLVPAITASAVPGIESPVKPALQDTTPLDKIAGAQELPKLEEILEEADDRKPAVEEKVDHPPTIDDLNYDTIDRGDATAAKPTAVPIRVAAPSSRATPPRPPKSHRQPTERHLPPKKEDKLRSVAAATIDVPKVVRLDSALTVIELADRMGVSETEIIKHLFMKGFMRTVNQMVELELARELAREMEYELASAETVELEEPVPEVELSEEDKAKLVMRPPVVTIMGHVDHGKTSLLDAIRQTKFQITDAEAGGITQHIGAYHVEVPGEDGSTRQVVFLDTPGHEAFTAMRARGAKATDIAILVVAADDGVMPQTIEAIDHVKAAGVPMIVAVNKIDRPESDPDRVLNQLMEHGLLPDKFGGDTVTVNVSAKKRIGLDDLLEMILLVADIADLKANPDRQAVGTIIEAELSRGRGAVATALVQNGTLREGDLLVAGSKSGRVRALFDDRGERVKAAGPSMPVAVLGLDEVPAAGDRFEVVEDAQAAKLLVELRRSQETKTSRHVTLESLHDLLEKGEMKELNVIIKADVQGTAEAIAGQVQRLSTPQVQVAVVRTASGAITENDVNLAASCNAIIIGFNAEPDQNASRVREQIGVDVRSYSIIYQITDDLEKAIQGLIQPVKKEVQLGTAEIRQIFKMGKNLTIAGSYITSGKIQRGSIAKVERDGKIIYEGKLDTLKRFKDDVREVAQGFECGIGLEKFNDIQPGDLVHSYIIQ